MRATLYDHILERRVVFELDAAAGQRYLQKRSTIELRGVEIAVPLRVRTRLDKIDIPQFRHFPTLKVYPQLYNHEGAEQIVFFARDAQNQEMLYWILNGFKKHEIASLVKKLAQYIGA